MLSMLECVLQKKMRGMMLLMGDQSDLDLEEDPKEPYFAEVLNLGSTGYQKQAFSSPKII